MLAHSCYTLEQSFSWRPTHRLDVDGASLGQGQRSGGRVRVRGHAWASMVTVFCQDQQTQECLLVLTEANMSGICQNSQQPRNHTPNPLRLTHQIGRAHV